MTPSNEKSADGKVSLSISVLCIDQVRLESNLEGLASLGIERIHVDLIDPAYENLGLPPEIVQDLRARFSYPIDVHLMVNCPETFILELIDRGASSICVHQKAVTHNLLVALEQARSAGLGVGLAINPDESIDINIVNEMNPDRLTVMAVLPGGVGRPFHPEALDTIRIAAGLRATHGVQSIEVDGAVGPLTAGLMIRQGADQLVLGSRVFPHRSTACSHLPQLSQAIRHARQKGIQ